MLMAFQISPTPRHQVHKDQYLVEWMAWSLMTISIVEGQMTPCDAVIYDDDSNEYSARVCNCFQLVSGIWGE
jgi:hypothetical protein